MFFHVFLFLEKKCPRRRKKSGKREAAKGLPLTSEKEEEERRKKARVKAEAAMQLTFSGSLAKGRMECSRGGRMTFFPAVIVDCCCFPKKAEGGVFLERKKKKKGDIKGMIFTRKKSPFVAARHGGVVAVVNRFG